MTTRSWCAVVAAATLAAAQSRAAEPPRSHFASLSVQVLPTEEGVQVSHALRVTGAGEPVSWTFPLLLPEGLPGPVPAPRTDAVPNGIDSKASGGAEVRFEADGIRVTGRPGPSGDFSAQVRYSIPVATGRATFAVRPGFPVGVVQVTTRRTPAYGLHVRPLAPYAYREEVEEDGTWQYLVLGDGIDAGERLEVAVAHLPAPFGPYRAAALGVAGLAAVALAWAVIAPRKTRRKKWQFTAETAETAERNG
ncbi:MAG: hypothetical protein FJ087_12505 [Deltaproteobacteria bacterium]|nr:hypothetical protein [Deltaproteobacteria bacterium]